MGAVIPFAVEFDATDMSIDAIREEARERGWPGIHIDIDDFKKTGKLIVRRLSRKEAYCE